MADGAGAPRIVRRKTVVQGAHHGGAWKVAYADFVTAMMAFFLLMWLLGATNEKQRKGIADYFNPSIAVNRISGGGDGAFGGDSVFTENTLAENGTGAAQMYATQQQASRGDMGLAEAGVERARQSERAMLEKMAAELSGIGGESMVSELLARHIVTRLSDEGLIVELFDIPDTPLFDTGSQPAPVLRNLLRAVAEVFRLAKNDVAIQSHVAAVPIVALSNPVWDQSTARAEAVRAGLLAEGLAEARVQRLTGFADRKPAVRNLMSSRNNRIEIILLRKRL